MEKFEQLYICHFKWIRPSNKIKLTREQLIVVDVMTVIIDVQGEGFKSWWEATYRLGNIDEEFPRVVESFRLAGLDNLADIVSQTSFCRKIIAAGIGRAVAEGFPRLAKFRFSREQKQMLWELERRFNEKGPDAREALLRFLPSSAA